MATNNSVAFAFDIDGVLVNGKTPIPGARDTLRRLQEEKIPFIFLTNSGGVTEKINLSKLESRLGDISFDEAQIIQSHTPYQAVVSQYERKTVLVLGGHGDNIRQVATEYGFEDVVTSSDLVSWNEHVHPFPEMTQEHHAQYGQTGWPRKIDAILVWSSPRDWCLDLQVTLDLLLSSKGVIGTRSELNGNKDLPNNGYLQDGQPTLYFCNPDFEWSTKHEQPRLAQGAFREALRGIWRQATDGNELKYDLCGKPTFVTYNWSENRLQCYIDENPGLDGRNIKTVYMIGDNPESDIAGANAFNDMGPRYQWRSILVETGVYRAGTVPAHTPTHTAKDVKAAVEWALAQPQDKSEQPPT